MDDELCRLGEDLITTSARVVRWVPRSTEYNLSLAAARILARLSDGGPTRISDLAHAERCSQPTVTNHIKRLEAAGLVTRRADPRDARAWMIELSPRGQQQLRDLRRSLGITLQPYLTRMSRRDLQALRDGVEAMRRLMATDA